MKIISNEGVNKHAELFQQEACHRLGQNPAVVQPQQHDARYQG